MNNSTCKKIERLQARLPARAFCLCLLVISCMLGGPNAYAQRTCSYYSSDTTGVQGSWVATLDIPKSIVIPAGAGVGTVVASVTSPTPPFAEVGNTCTVGAPVSQSGKNLLANGTLNGDIVNIGNSGIGYRVKETDTGIIFTAITGTYTPLPDAYSFQKFSRIYAKKKFTLEFVITGSVQSGPISVTGNIWVWNVRQASNVLVPLVVLAASGSGTTSVVVPPKTCAITQPGAANLGSFSTKDFTGIGSASGWGQDFTIGVNCSGVRSNVHMVFSDARNNANTSSILSLSSTSTASGVGIEIWRKNGSAPISFGPDSSSPGTTNQFFVFASDGSTTGPMQLVFTPRYIKTATTVTPGSANGLATFTMSFQ